MRGRGDGNQDGKSVTRWATAEYITYWDAYVQRLGNTSIFEFVCIDRERSVDVGTEIISKLGTHVEQGKFRGGSKRLGILIQYDQIVLPPD